MATAPTISDLGKVAGSLQVAHIEAVGHGRTAGKVHCNGNILSTAGNITATTGTLTLGATSSQIVLGTTTTTTLSATAPASSVTLTIPDPGVSCNVMLGLKAVTTAVTSTTTTLTVANSGRFVFVPQATGASSIIALPAVATCIGWHVRLIFTAAANGTHTWTISAPSAIMSGVSTSVAGAGAATITNHAAVTSLIRSAVANDTKAGDFVDIYSNGAAFYFFASSSGTATPWSTA